MKFIVDRQTWYRGKGVSGSKLLRTDGQRCCIGFVAGQSGVPDDDLRNVSGIHSNGPGRTIRAHCVPKWMTDKYDVGSSDLATAYTVNDNRVISDSDREAQLKELFAANGDEIEFIN